MNNTETLLEEIYNFSSSAAIKTHPFYKWLRISKLKDKDNFLETVNHYIKAKNLRLNYTSTPWKTLKFAHKAYKDTRLHVEGTFDCEALFSVGGWGMYLSAQNLGGFNVNITEKLRAILESTHCTSLYNLTGEHFYLEICKGNILVLKYQHILGSKRILKLKNLNMLREYKK